MLTGPALGAAIEEAMRLKGVGRSETARHFGIRPESTYDWTRYGRIAKKHLPKLFAYFADVVGPEHWGMPPVEPSQPARLDTAKLASLIETVEAAVKNAERVPLKAPITARMKARLIVNLYADSGSKPPTAKTVAAELARIMKAEEVTDEPPPAR